MVFLWDRIRQTFYESDRIRIRCMTRSFASMKSTFLILIKDKCLTQCCGTAFEQFGSGSKILPTWVPDSDPLYWFKLSSEC